MDIVNEIKKIPPVTRFLVLSFVGVSLPVFAHVVPGYLIPYTHELVWNRFQIWRLYTTFFMGNQDISFIFEVAMLFQMGNSLETGAYKRKSADLAFQLFCAGLCVIALSFPFSTSIYFRPFLHCLAYIYSSLAPLGAQISIFGLISFPIVYYPYILLGFEFLSPGGPRNVATALPGTVTGHLWWWSVWGSAGVGGGGGVLEEWARAPVWLREWFGQEEERTTQAGRGQANQGGGVTVIPPRQFANASSGGGGGGGASSSSTGSSSGYNWGSGQRLGSD